LLATVYGVLGGASKGYSRAVVAGFIGRHFIRWSESVWRGPAAG